MKSLWRAGLTATIATYMLIFIGGLVRVSGAGLGCPDWPKCFGRWIPPTDVAQLPPNIDPSLFNFTLAWIEWLNRLAGMVVGIIIAVTAVMALFVARRYPRILWPAVAAGLLTAFQGWQGSVVITSELEPLVVTVHGVIAMIIVSLLIWVTQQSYYEFHPEEQGANYMPKGAPRWLTLIWLAAIVQVILGTRMREGLEIVSDRHPLMSPAEWIAKVGAVSHVHMGLGILVVAVTWWIGNKVLKGTERLTPLVRQAMIWSIVIGMLQVISGALFIFFDLPAIVRVFHLWLAALYVGSLLIVFAASRRSRQSMQLEVSQQ
jgi:cytochrome c oxidase assembly protein subunit 15